MSESSRKNGFGDLRRCLQCAICTGSCPAARVIEGYNPRAIILRRLLHDDQPPSGDADLLWCCTTCHTCEERCPHGISVGGLLIEIMNEAARRGRLPDAIRQTLATLARTGRAIPTTPRVERMRKELGLPPLRDCNTEKVRELLRRCGVDAMLEAKCE